MLKKIMSFRDRNYFIYTLTIQFYRPHDLNPSVHAQPHERAPYCHNRLMQGHTALEYCSQPLTEIWIEPNVSNAFH